MKADKKILDRIKKCLALGGSPNEHEAESAMRMAFQLMNKYSITEADIQNSEYTARFGRSHREYYRTDEKAIARLIVRHFNVRIVRTRDSNQREMTGYEILGKDHEVEIAWYVFDFLFNTVRRMWKEYKKPHNTTADYNSFALGFLHSISDKLEQDAKDFSDGATAEELALVRSKSNKELDRYVKSRYSNLSSGSRKTKYHGNEYASGKEAGSKVNLRKAVNQNSNQRLLGN